MASNPFFYQPTPNFYDATVTRDTSGAEETLRTAIASRPSGMYIPPRGNIAYNPDTQEYAVAGKVVGRLDINRLENLIQQSMELGPQDAEPPSGFQSVDERRFAAVLAEARKNPTANIGAFWDSAQQSLGSTVSAVGALFGSQGMENPWGDAIEQGKLDQPWAQQASYDETTNWLSTAGLGTNLAQAAGQLAPAASAALINPVAGVVVNMLTAGGAQADAARQQFWDAANTMTDEELMQDSAGYRQLMQQNPGMTRDEALNQLSIDARRIGLGIGVVEGGIEAFLGTKLLTGMVKRMGGTALAERLATGALGRIPKKVFQPFDDVAGVNGALGTGLAAGGFEGGSAIVGDLAVNERARDLLGQDASYGMGDAWQSFATEAPLGFVAGILGRGISRPASKNPTTGTEFDALNKSRDQQTPPTAPAVPPRGTGMVVRQPQPGDVLDTEYLGPLYTPQPPPPAQLPPPVAPGPDGWRGPINVPPGGFQYQPSQEPPFAGQQEFQFQEQQAPNVEGNYRAPLMQDDYARQDSPQGQLFPQADRPAGPAYTPRVDVSRLFNEEILPVIRQREDEQGRGQGSPIQAIQPAEALAPAQVMSSIAKAVEDGLLTRKEATALNRRISAMMVKRDTGVMPQATTPAAPQATPPAAPQTPEVTPAEAQAGAVAAETNPEGVTPEGEQSVAAQVKAVARGRKPAALVVPADAPQGKLPPKAARAVAAGRVTATPAPQGVVVTKPGPKTQQVREKVAAGEMTDAEMAKTLGYDLEKAKSDGSVVIVETADGSQALHEELTTADRMADRAAALAEQYGKDLKPGEKAPVVLTAAGRAGLQLALDRRAKRAKAASKVAKVQERAKAREDLRKQQAETLKAALEKVAAERRASQSKAAPKAEPARAAKPTLATAMEQSALQALRAEAKKIFLTGKVTDKAILRRLEQAKTVPEIEALYREAKDGVRELSPENIKRLQKAARVAVEGENGVGKQTAAPTSTTSTPSRSAKPTSSTPKADRSSSRARKNPLNAEVAPATSDDPSPRPMNSAPSPSLRSTTLRVGTPVDVIRREVDKLTKRLGRNAPDIEVVATPEDLPDSIKNDVHEYSYAEGFYDPATGRVYLVASNIDAGDVRRVLAHEVIGHFGIENVVTEAGWAEIEADIADLRASGDYKKFFDLLDRHYPEDSFSPRERAMEAVARIAELQPDAGVVQKVIDFIRRTLAALGYEAYRHDIVANLPESIRRALSDSREYVRTGDPGTRVFTERRASPSLTSAAKPFVSGDTQKKLHEYGRKLTGNRVTQTVWRALHHTFTLRDQQDYVGDDTLWGKSFSSLVDLIFRKNAFINNELARLAESTRHYNALDAKRRQAVRQLMLDTQKYSLNPKVALDKHSWVAGDLRRKPEVIENHAKLVRDYEALGDLGRQAFDGLAERNRAIATDYINARMAVYRDMVKKGPDKDGLPESIANPALKTLEDDLQQVQAGNLNFSTQRAGDWIVVVPHHGTHGILLGEFGTEAEVDAELRDIRARSPYTKADKRKVGSVWEVRLNEPALYTFDSRAEAEAAIESIREEVFQDLLTNSKGDVTKATEAINELWSTASPDDPNVMMPNVVAKQRAEMYGEQAFGSFTPEQVRRLNKMLKDKEISAAGYEMLMEDYLKASESTNVTLSRLRRRLVRGATEKDMLDAYVRRYTSMVHALASARVHSQESALRNDLMSDALQKSFTFKTGKDPVLALNALQAHEDATATMLKRGAANLFYQSVRGLTTFLNLALSPAYALMNVTQPHVLGVPWLASQVVNGQQVTFAEATAAVTESLFSISSYRRLAEEIAAGVASDVNVMRGKATSREQFTADAILDIVETWSHGMNAKDKAAFLDLVLGPKNALGEREGGLMEQDALALSYTDSVYDAMNATQVGDTIKRIERMSMSLGKLTEIGNRLTMARAAFRIASNKGMAGAELESFVAQSIYRSQGDFSRTNRAAVFNHPFWGTAFQFKTYVQLVYGLFIKNFYNAIRPGATRAERKAAFRMIAGMISTHAVAGGVTGLGYFGSMVKATAVLFGFGASDDEELDEFLSTDALWRRGLREMLDDPSGESMLYALITNGVPAAVLDVDAAERIAIPKLVDTRFIRVDPDNESQSFLNGVIAQSIGGAPYSTAVRLLDGASMMVTGVSDGNTRDAWLGLAKVLPQLPSNIIKASDKDLRGVIDQSGRDIIPSDQIMVGDILTNVMGFRTYSETSTQQRRSDFFQTKSEINERRNELLKSVARARGDDAVRLRETIDEFNKSVPAELRITPETLVRSMKQRSRGDNKDDKAVRALVE